MKKLFFSLALLTILGLSVNAQTNVSGGIYSNTTWTLAGSPYTVTDTVYIFPNVTLTIQPGVVVKFSTYPITCKSKGMIKAIGTSSDSITFTTTGAHCIGTYLYYPVTNYSIFDYCIFEYAGTGFYLGDSIYIKNSSFRYNEVGIYEMASSRIDSCYFSNNTFALENMEADQNFMNKFVHNHYAFYSGYSNFTKCTYTDNDTAFYDNDDIHLINSRISGSKMGIYSFSGADNMVIDNCVIDSNKVGWYVGGNFQQSVITHNEFAYDSLGVYIYHGSSIYMNPTAFTKNIIENNTIGILFGTYTNFTNGGFDFYCNKLCNNSMYDLKYLGTSYTLSVPGNYWCTPDSASTETVIYDGFDNPAYDLVYFMPLDTMNCYIDSTCRALFYLYPDMTTPHYYYAVNLSSGTGGAGLSHYLWNWGDGTTDTTACPSHTYATAGNYNISLKITDSTGCTNTYSNYEYLSKRLPTTSSIIYVNVVPSITTVISENHNNSNSLSVYPNPTKDNLTIDVSATLNILAIIEITNIQGQVIEQQTTNVATTNLDVSSLARGMYFVKVKTEKGVAVKKFIKE